MKLEVKATSVVSEVRGKKKENFWKEVVLQLCEKLQHEISDFSLGFATVFLIIFKILFLGDGFLTSFLFERS